MVTRKIKFFLLPLISNLNESFNNYREIKRTRGFLIRDKNVRTSKNCEFEKVVYASNNSNFFNSRVGRYSYFGTGCMVENCRIGRYCSVASGVHIGLRAHSLNPFVSTHPFFHSKTLGHSFFERSYADKKYFNGAEALTEVGNDVWIGKNALIKSGLKIGDGAVIGAGAVVTKDVPPYAIVGGVPAKLIRYRFNKKQIGFLLRFKWWEKPDKWIKENWRDFLDIEKLIRKNEK